MLSESRQKYFTIFYFIKKGIRLEGLKVILILVGFNCRRCYLNVVDGLQLSLEDELNDGEKGHEEDKDEDDDEEVKKMMF